MSTVPQTAMQRMVYRLKSSALLISAGKYLNPARRIEMQWILEGLSYDVRGRILDIGCGDGFWSAFVNRKTGGTVVGIDPFEVDIDIARRRHSNRASFVLGTAESLPFENETFDAVISVCVFEHLIDDEQALDEIRRVLRPGGVFAATVDSLDAPGISESYRRWHAEAFRCARFYPAGSLDAVLVDRGFSVVRSRSLMGTPLGIWWEMFSEQHRLLKHVIMPFVIVPVMMQERRTNVHGFKYGVIAKKPEST